MGRNQCTENCNICLQSPRICDDTFKSAIDKGICGNYCSECYQSCLCCDGKFKEAKKSRHSVNFSYFKPYFDVTLGKVVESKHEINEYCKRNDMVYAGDRELTQQCKQNKRENEQKQDRAFVAGLTEKLMGINN